MGGPIFHRLASSFQQSRGLVKNLGVFVGNAQAGGAAGLVAALATSVVPTQVDVEIAHWPPVATLLGLEPGRIEFADQGWRLLRLGGLGWSLA